MTVLRTKKKETVEVYADDDNEIKVALNWGFGKIDFYLTTEEAKQFRTMLSEAIRKSVEK